MVKRMVRKGFVLTALMAGFGLVPAQAGLFDSLFEKPDPARDAASAEARMWRLNEFSAVQLVDQEAGAPANQHPATLNADALRTQFARLETVQRQVAEPLFDSEELVELVPVLVKALSLAAPGEDVQLVSTARRGGALAAPRAVTARLFVQGDALQFIVNDTRLEFVNDVRRTRTTPKFGYGSRTQVGDDSVRSSTGASRRSDWVALPLAALTVAAATEPAATAVAPARPAAPAAAKKPAAAATEARPATLGDEVEQRLVTLKRLRERDLISEEEYQQKRREVLEKL
ncbi:SHOCT domain-containing protein [Piscinibacter sp.]|uniref:SHOCT domain-containing protein n=1 Tax=Piscinibacter sp. TaxID=1903157 RepID=UPI002C8FA09A|nr:SHOCT domain-containing protein [Albitalea sp.]HUG24010.1 SHOCT domain-containing protein [Albitalea sp.]